MIKLERKESKNTYGSNVYMSATVNGITFYADSNDDHGVCFNDDGGECVTYIQSGENIFVPHSSMTDKENEDSFLSAINSYLDEQKAPSVLLESVDEDESSEMPY